VLGIRDWLASFREQRRRVLKFDYLLGGAAKDEILLPNALVTTSPTLSPLVGEIFQGSRFDAVEKRRRTPPG
jgi:hypothetical protein